MGGLVIYRWLDCRNKFRPSHPAYLNNDYKKSDNPKSLHSIPLEEESKAHQASREGLREEQDWARSRFPGRYL